MQELTFDVPGVSCEHCVNSITKATKELGVNDVKVDLPSKKVFVAFDPAAVTEPAIKAAIEEEGYDITGEEPGNTIPSVGQGKKTFNLKSL
jgi:copper chaperone